MVAQIVVNQMGKPAGIAGRAREDLDTGMTVALSAAGGPFSAHLWELVYAPIDVLTPAQSAATLATPFAASTNLSPIDHEGTYKVRLTVDSGSGLGASAADIAEITFAAQLPSNPLASDPAELPRRIPAYTERTEHNVADTLFPLGNPLGWAHELIRWFAAINRMALGKSFAWARVALPGGGPAAVVPTGAFNVASVTRTGLGTVDVVFTRQAANANYAVVPALRGAAGNAAASSEAVSGFTMLVYNSAGALADIDFTFEVKHRPV